MRQFTELYRRLDETSSTNEKIAALADYFSSAPHADAAWTVYFLTGGKLKRLVKTAELRQWVMDATGYDEWMVRECHSAVGDLAETIALLLDDPAEPGTDFSGLGLAQWVARLKGLRTMEDRERGKAVRGWWSQLPTDGRFVLNKLLTGAFRVGVSKRLVTRGLAQAAELDAATVAHRLMGRWQPTAESFAALLAEDDGAADLSRPYPFFLASPLESQPAELGERDQWQTEWKWDGIRGQLVKRQGEVFIWSRGEDLLEGRFPILEDAASHLPDGSVLDGEILAWRDEAPLPFALLQKRIGKLKPSAKLLDRAPVAFVAYDLLEYAGKDLREAPLSQRRSTLEQVIEQADHPRLRTSEVVEANSWPALETLRKQSRERGVEGFMLKRLDSPYRVGRKRGDWWKWKVDPFTADGVLLYAQPGSGRRSNLLTDYTFGIWDGDTLVPFAKAYSGLTDKEIRKLDRWIRRHTTDRFGPVRQVEREHVFEIAFEGIARSSRHKSGVAVRFPRIARWREDLSIKDADKLETVEALIRVVD